MFDILLVLYSQFKQEPINFMRMEQDSEEVLKEIENFAARAHSGQTRKHSTEPYIHHPIRVMNLLRPYTQDVTILAAALLHDVLEDTNVSGERLLEFLLQHMNGGKARRTAALVDELTDVYVKADYPQWNRTKRKQMELKRLEKTSAESQTIRYADVIDNCNHMAEGDPEFAPTFLHECLSLLKRTRQGNPELYKKALVAVQQELQQLQLRNAPRP